MLMLGHLCKSSGGKHVVILCFVCWLREFILLQGMSFTEGQLALYANVWCLRRLDFFPSGFLSYGSYVSCFLYICAITFHVECRLRTTPGIIYMH